LERKKRRAKREGKNTVEQKKRGVAARREEIQTLPSTNKKSCFLPSLGVVVQ